MNSPLYLVISFVFSEQLSHTTAGQERRRGPKKVEHKEWSYYKQDVWVPNAEYTSG